jgi:hypothetical protein
LTTRTRSAALPLAATILVAVGSAASAQSALAEYEVTFGASWSAATHPGRAQGVDILTIGQYLQPTPEQLPVVRYAPPEEFVLLAREWREMGFWHVESGPLVRSSYHASNHRPEPEVA